MNADGVATSVTVEPKSGSAVTVQTRCVISNIGPVATSALVPASAWPAGYTDTLQQQNYPGTLITINFATSAPIPNLKTLVFFGLTNRLSYAFYMSGPSPRLAPVGKHLYCVTSTPHPASTGFDTDAEIEFLKKRPLPNFPNLPTLISCRSQSARETGPGSVPFQGGTGQMKHPFRTCGRRRRCSALDGGRAKRLRRIRSTGCRRNSRTATCGTVGQGDPLRSMSSSVRSVKARSPREISAASMQQGLAGGVRGKPRKPHRNECIRAAPPSTK